jgi:hypothetical protein
MRNVPTAKESWYKLICMSMLKIAKTKLASTFQYLYRRRYDTR